MKKKEIKKPPNPKFDESFGKITRFLKSRPTKDDLKRFIAENPEHVVHVTKKDMERINMDIQKFIESNPEEEERIKMDQEFALREFEKQKGAIT